MGPEPMRPIVRNWVETARYFLHAVRGNYLADGTTERGTLLNRLLGYPDARALYEFSNTPPSSDAVFTFNTDNETSKLRVSVTLATLGTPITAAAQEFRIEYFSSEDNVTEHVSLSLKRSAG
tara:strand:+ start:2032 stop:2397 length:366 start_codon:yes stop_codon:yes gene_type:complete